MQQVARSEHISKFPPVTDAAPAHNQPPETPDQPPAPAPTPPPAEKPDLNQEIAKRHSRTASAEPPETDQPLPEAAEEADTKPGFFKRLFTARPRLTSATAAVLSVLVLAGYVTYLNFPNIALRVAASKAGFTARMPNYLPNDYDFSGPVAYGPGRIVVNFTSDDGNTVALTQRQTNLDSQSLLENHVLEKTDKYLTFYEKGLTIYIYNGNNAAWVNRGVLYEISGNNLLNSEQVIRMATSL